MTSTNAEGSERTPLPADPEDAVDPAVKARPVATAEAPDAAADPHPVVYELHAVTRTFGRTVAVDRLDLAVRAGTFYGIIGPNGAGKTTTLSMMTGLLRPDTGRVLVHGVDVWKDPAAAKKLIGVLPDRLRLFDRLTGAQFLFYAAALRGIDRATAKKRAQELAEALGLTDALERLISDYSAGMAKKVALAGAMIHAPRVLVLDEPFESVDPVSSAAVITVLRRFVAGGGTVVLSSHGLDFIERVCDDVAVIVGGRVLASGAVEDVAGTATLEERFLELAGGKQIAEGLQWLHDFSS
ncbi:ABC transporter ATP-binding protein [Rathayibacter sp. ZW T2_19]|uniref:ABC transporter ATP-binding protein n=1 Tax=Rathayibacter rubneri TaxID=2950106 RepID=A0A9X2E1H8_9MICO|nr:ABC transporter ATP-binding protein [Rathayibacter rubneri]MCM6764166.1 ABC transporter ATP-binding protein [Rathayibacter rubneri]